MYKMKPSLPPTITKYFWGDDLSQLSWEKNEKYITQTILEKGDHNAISWLLSHVDKSYLKKQLPHLKLSDKSTNFWSQYLA